VTGGDIPGPRTRFMEDGLKGRSPWSLQGSLAERAKSGADDGHPVGCLRTDLSHVDTHGSPPLKS
jgi:hypothetical protein